MAMASQKPGNNHGTVAVVGRWSRVFRCTNAQRALHESPRQYCVSFEKTIESSQWGGGFWKHAVCHVLSVISSNYLGFG